MKKLLRRRGGFTLIELLIAVGILGVLAGIAVPVVLHVRGSSETTAAEAELSNVQSAIDSLMADKGISAFATTSPITATANALRDTVGEATSDMTQFPYSDGDWALCPASGTKYLRNATTQGTYYVDTDGDVHQQTTGYE